ncbi:ExbD/TolR family protein [Pontivivens ytuae]|uniref:Biopolymer transporter ExbD n=1 Tax=Pontivivens ytuae TaxID=2789856 RepID=A0A7S9QEV2_9RHOB|nr:biopolymer transporter ExbD [Pontivivens ytuae]QPH55596.1 biopolymer transporter ExbD [Pontivivens ytuae]
MIDVVFLLLVFFMLAARFGIDSSFPLQLAGSGGGAYSGPPRLVDVLPEGQRLNGQQIESVALITRLGELTETPTDAIVLRPRDDAELQRVVDVLELLTDAGFETVVLVE